MPEKSQTLNEPKPNSLLKMFLSPFSILSLLLFFLRLIEYTMAASNNFDDSDKADL